MITSASISAVSKASKASVIKGCRVRVARAQQRLTRKAFEAFETAFDKEKSLKTAVGGTLGPEGVGVQSIGHGGTNHHSFRSGGRSKPDGLLAGTAVSVRWCRREIR